jgi:hypothetical protein
MMLTQLLPHQVNLHAKIGIMSQILGVKISMMMLTGVSRIVSSTIGHCQGQVTQLDL